jgi:hypothetical protein
MREEGHNRDSVGPIVDKVEVDQYRNDCDLFQVGFPATAQRDASNENDKF